MTAADRRNYLSDQHAAVLAASVILPEVAAERGYRTIDDVEEDKTLLRECRIPGWARVTPGLLIPLYRVTGEQVSWSYRPDVSPTDNDGKARKYVAPYGRASVLDVHPRNRDRIREVKTPLLITEGVKKADALTSADLCAIALSGVFNWRSRLGTLGDWEDVPLKGRVSVSLVWDSDARTKPDVTRAMIRCGRWLKSKGVKTVWYIVTPGEVNGTEVKGVDDYLAAGGTVEGLRRAATKTPPRLPTAADTFTDARMAETIADDVLDGRYLWTAGLGWLEHTGQRWTRAPEAAVREKVRRYTLERFAAAARSGDTTQADGWRSMLSLKRELAVLTLTKGIVLADAADFDQHPDLLNTPSCVVDLTTGAPRPPHDPALLMMKMTRVEYVPDATHEDWDAALKAIPDDAVAEWLQTRYGQGITGHMTPDDRLVIQHGAGENGKTTITAGIQGALGDYYLLVSDRVLLANPDAHPTELMDLQGVRLAMIEETPEARHLNVQRLKKTVGTPQITARRLYKDSVTFDATHSMFLSSNHRPIIEEVDWGTWRRLVLVTYPFTFRKTDAEVVGPLDRKGDPTLRQRVKAGLDGQHEAALAWLVKGAVRWYKDGRVLPEPPPNVEADTWAWRVESDLVLGFISERLFFDLDAHLPVAEFQSELGLWLRGRGHREWSDKLIGSRFGSHDEFISHDVKRQTVRNPNYDPTDPFSVGLPTYKAWLGVRLRTEEDPLPPDMTNVDISSAAVPENDLASKPDNALTRDVTAVTAEPKTALKSVLRDIFDSAVTAVTKINSEDVSQATEKASEEQEKTSPRSHSHISGPIAPRVSDVEDVWDDVSHIGQILDDDHPRADEIPPDPSTCLLGSKTYGCAKTGTCQQPESCWWRPPLSHRLAQPKGERS